MIVLFTTLSAFSKESGVTAPSAVAVTLIYLRRSQGRKIFPLATIIGLFGSLIAALAAYALMRGRSGAIPITFSANDWYSYAMSLSVLFENLFRRPPGRVAPCEPSIAGYTPCLHQRRRRSTVSYKLGRI
jgi:hypothetical protein